MNLIVLEVLAVKENSIGAAGEKIYAGWRSVATGASRAKPKKGQRFGRLFFAKIRARARVFSQFQANRGDAFSNALVILTELARRRVAAIPLNVFAESGAHSSPP